GKPDLVDTNYSIGIGFYASVLLNTTAPGASTATFAARQDFTTGTGPRSVAIADLNGDGKPDLVVGNSTSDSVSVLLNTTAPGATMATFAAKQDFATGTGPRSVAIADLNGDGKPDIVTADTTSHSVSVLLNTTAPGAATLTLAPRVDFASVSYS